MTRQRTMTCWQALDAYPPYFVRLAAKSSPHQAMSDAEIAIAAGLPLDRVRQIKMLTTWATATVGEIRAFFAACKFDPTSGVDRQRIWQYNQRCEQRKAKRFQYLFKHPKYESELLPVMKLAASQPMAA